MQPHPNIWDFISLEGILSILTLLGIIIGATWKFGLEIRALYVAIDKAKKELQAEGVLERERIFQRFDEYKMKTETTFVRKDVCHLLHQQTAELLKEFRSSYESQNTQIITALTKVEDKMDKFITAMHSRIDKYFVEGKKQ